MPDGVASGLPPARSENDLTENKRDSGLLRSVGPWALAAGIVNAIIGAGIFAVPSALAAAVGPYAPFAFLGCAVVVAAAAICFAEGGSRIPTSGGIYGYVAAAFGPLAGYIAGTSLWISNALACGGVAAALADVSVSMLPHGFAAPAHAAIIVGVIGCVAIVNINGVTHGARLAGTITVLKLLPLAVFVIVGAAAMQRGNFQHIALPATSGIGRALILAVFAFIGMETPLSVSGEVAQPSRSIPRALAIATVSVTLVYVGVQCVAQGILGPLLAESTAPLADAMGRVSPVLRLLMVVGAAISMIGWISSDVLGTPRALFAFARDGLLPRALGRVHTRNHTPHIAILVYAIIITVLALSGSFAELAVLSTLTTAGLYIAGCSAAWVLARRSVAQAGTPLNFRWLGVAASIAIIGMLAMVALASRAEILGLVILIAVSALIYLLQIYATAGRSPTERDRQYLKLSRNVGSGIPPLSRYAV